MKLSNATWGVTFAVFTLMTFAPALFSFGSFDSPLPGALLTAWVGATGMLLLTMAAMATFLYSFTKP